MHRAVIFEEILCSHKVQLLGEALHIYFSGLKFVENFKVKMKLFENQFEAFSKFGDPKSNGSTITLSQSDKWMKQANVFGKHITTTDTAIHFRKLKSIKLDLASYNAFISDLAKVKDINVDELKNKMISCGLPRITKAKTVSNLKLKGEK